MKHLGEIAAVDGAKMGMDCLITKVSRISWDMRICCTEIHFCTTA